MAGQTFTLSTGERTYYKMFTADVNVAGLSTTATKGMSATQPSGTGTMVCRHANLAKLIFTASTDGHIATAHVYGWSKSTTGDWISNYIAEIKYTTGTEVVAGTLFSTGHLLADILELEYGDTATKIITDTHNNVASATIDLEGAAVMEVVWGHQSTDGVASTATAANCAAATF